MRDLVGLFPYVVSASGNNGNPRSSSYAGSLAYPAKFDTVEFGVAGFKFENFSYPLGDFSQVEKDVGPQFAAPGFNMLSSAINPENRRNVQNLYGWNFSGSSSYHWLRSIGSRRIQRHILQRDNIEGIVWINNKMNGSLKWKNDIGLGMIDIRTALLCLHTLKEIKNQGIELELEENDLISHILSLIFNNSDAMSGKMGIVRIREDLAVFTKKLKWKSFIC